jgi:hypothetical protein
VSTMISLSLDWSYTQCGGILRYRSASGFAAFNRALATSGFTETVISAHFARPWASPLITETGLVSGSNMTTRLFIQSVTSTSPSPSTATLVGMIQAVGIDGHPGRYDMGVGGAAVRVDPGLQPRSEGEQVLPVRAEFLHPVIVPVGHVNVAVVVQRDTPGRI